LPPVAGDAHNDVADAVRAADLDRVRPKSDIFKVTIDTYQYRRGCPHGRRRRRGFTLMEATLATIIVGVGVTAAMTLFDACTRQNRAAASMTTAMHLAQNIQETMAGLALVDPAFGSTYFGAANIEPGQKRGVLSTYDDVDDFDGENYCPPIDSTRQPIPALSQYTQSISVWPVDKYKLTQNSNPAAPDTPQTVYTGAVRVTVRILYQRTPTDAKHEVYRTSWIRVAD
jgi:type II secretory pathway pseudopilin PulG